MRKLITAATLVLAATSPAFAGDDKGCQLIQAASLEMGMDQDGVAYVPMSIAGQTINMDIDTGGIMSMLSENTVDRVGLTRQPIFGAMITMYGGKNVTHFVAAHNIALGRLKASGLQMLVIPDGFLDEGVGGTLAADILRAYDDEFDFANGKFNLFLRNECEGSVVYWTRDPYAEIPFKTDDDGHIEMTVVLNGKEVRALFDSGTSRSVMSLETAKRLFDIKDDDPRLKSVGDVGGHGFSFPFESLAFEGEVKVAHPDITLVSNDVSRMQYLPPLILGMGILRQLRLYIAYRDKTIYVTAAGAH